MIGLFDRLEDESEPSQGQEIGAAVASAVASAVTELGRSQEAMAQTLARSMSEALRAAGPRDEVPARAPPRQLTFRVERDAKGFMTGVVVTSE